MLSPSEIIVDRQKIESTLAGIKEIGNQLPGIVTLHNLIEGKIEWMCDYGLDLLGVSSEEIFNQPLLGLVEQFFHPVDIQENIPRILEFLNNSQTDELITYYERVKVKGAEDWGWFMGCAKILLRDDFNRPVLCTCTTFPINSMDQFAQKTSRLLDENRFVANNFKLFDTLTPREREILQLWATGQSAVETSAQIFISVLTVETHRKRIKKKLQVNNFFDIQQYAQAFDLI